MLDAGNQLLNSEKLTQQHEVGSMDELPYADDSQDIALLSLALQYTKHNPQKIEGKERVKTLSEMHRILRQDGVGVLTFPAKTFPDPSVFHTFCSVFERYLGFDIIQENTGLATSTDHEDSEFKVWVLTVRKVGNTSVEKMDSMAWEALAFHKSRTNSSANTSNAQQHTSEKEMVGARHSAFIIGSEKLTFSPFDVDGIKAHEEYQLAKQKYHRLTERLQTLMQKYKSIENIPEEMLLSISLEEVSQSTQEERDEYFNFLVQYYGTLKRVPADEISRESPVILIRGESRKGPFLCLGRIDGTTNKPCGYGKRYFYDSELHG